MGAYMPAIIFTRNTGNVPKGMQPVGAISTCQTCSTHTFKHNNSLWQRKNTNVHEHVDVDYVDQQTRQHVTHDTTGTYLTAITNKSRLTQYLLNWRKLLQTTISHMPMCQNIKLTLIIIVIQWFAVVTLVWVTNQLTQKTIIKLTVRMCRRRGGGWRTGISKFHNRRLSGLRGGGVMRRGYPLINRWPWVGLHRSCALWWACWRRWLYFQAVGSELTNGRLHYS